MSMQWKQAKRAEKMNPSVIREILKVTEKPGIISFAGGLPSPLTFPIAEFSTACVKVLAEDGKAALQYAASEGFAPLRAQVAAGLPWRVDPDQILITTGSQQGLDLLAKILIDAGSKIIVETPTYLGALQAFTPMEPEVVSVKSDDEGIDIADLKAKAKDARFLYVLPNFQNPTGRTMTEARRAALSAAAAEMGLPIIEDNPYGNPDGCVYLGSFSKVLAPGLRLGFMVLPKSLYPKILQAKQAADLHTPSFNQRVASEVMQGDFLQRHVPMIRKLYKSQRDAMLVALAREMPVTPGNPDASVTWNSPAGGMFLWVRLPAGLDAVKLLPKAVDKNVAFVPGAPFYADNADPRTLRLSFVTATVEQINIGMKALADTIKEAMPLSTTAA
jgi:2-aminoadipate transaminase